MYSKNEHFFCDSRNNNKLLQENCFVRSLENHELENHEIFEVESNNVDCSDFDEFSELEANTELYGDLAENCAKVHESDQEDEFMEEIDPQIPKCSEIFQMLQNLRLFCINEQLAHEYFDTFDSLESEIELQAEVYKHKSTKRKQRKITDYFK